MITFLVMIWLLEFIFTKYEPLDKPDRSRLLDPFTKVFEYTFSPITLNTSTEELTSVALIFKMPEVGLGKIEISDKEFVLIPTVPAIFWNITSSIITLAPTDAVTVPLPRI